MTETITLAHGSGGSATRELIRNVFLRILRNPELDQEGDAALVTLESAHIAFTTDSYTVNPLFFSGGDLGRMAVCGTVNDLAVAGAEPKYLSAGFILEEGLARKDLEKLVKSMANTAFECGVKIIAADVKVVEKGKGGGIYINTSGIGIARPGKLTGKIAAGDKIIVSGNLGDHELAVVVERSHLHPPAPVISDCAPINALTRMLLEQTERIKAMKDPSRGGLITALYKMQKIFKLGIILDEVSLPINDDTKYLTMLMGLDPLYLANQGKLILICAAAAAEEIVKIMRKHSLGKDTAIIGEVTDRFTDKIVLQKPSGAEIVLSLKAGSDSYRIC